jgi:hypothetical protein
VYRPLQFHERSQLFISAHNETLSAIAMCVSNPDCSSLAIYSHNAAPTPPGFAEPVSDDRLLAGHKPKASQSSAC